MSYYEDLKTAIIELERIVKLKGDGGANIESLIYEFTKQYPVGALTLKKRIKSMERMGLIKIEDGVAFWIQKD